jgi:hypothetical protein
MSGGELGHQMPALDDHEHRDSLASLSTFRRQLVEFAVEAFRLFQLSSP